MFISSRDRISRVQSGVHARYQAIKLCDGTFAVTYLSLPDLNFKCFFGECVNIHIYRSREQTIFWTIVAQATNHAFRYVPEENLVSSENIEHLKRIFELPIEVAERLTDDELCEDVTDGLDE